MRKCISPLAWAGALIAVLIGMTAGGVFAQASDNPEVNQQYLELRLGGSEIMTIGEPSYRMKVITSNDAIVDARPLKENKIYIRGKELGYCTVTIWDERTQNLMSVIDVTVTLDLTGLKQRLSELYPNEDIKVHGSEKGVVLSGTVSGPEVVEQVLRLTQNFLPRDAQASGGSGGSTGRSQGSITNLLKVGSIQQVMLEVKFAEVRRDSGRDWQAALGLGGLGSDFTGAAGIGNVLDGIKSTAEAPFPGVLPGGFPVLVEDAIADGLVRPAGSLLLNFADNPANIFINIDNFTAAFHFLESEGLARLLAEPRLVTQSGQEASFLAGGEFPIPVPQENDTITIEYKEFGVGLVFTPVVLGDGKISLRVAPSVSAIASSSAIPSGILGADFIVPSLTTRKLESTVQLYDGQTLALAGLLQDDINETVRKVPGLGDIPILGSLFRSSAFRQEKTDLLITVTPHLIKPERENSISYPGEYFQVPSRFEFYLEGRMEGRRSPDAPSAFGRHSFSEMMVPVSDRGGLEGEFGNQPVTMEQ